MSGLLCLTLRFLDPVPQFHGQGADGQPEWPPSPLRYFQAVVSAAASRWRNSQFQESALPALQWLESIQPAVVTPPVAVRCLGYPMYVPNNSGDLMTAAWARGDIGMGVEKFRVEKLVRTRHLYGDAVYYLFPLPEGVFPHLEVLRTAARAVTHLGWGIDMVAGDASILSEQEAAELPGERWVPTSDPGGTPLRAPIVGTLDALTSRHQAFLTRIQRDESGKESFHPVPPLTAFRVTHYRRTTDPLPRPFAVFELRNDDETFFTYPQNRLIHIAGMLRHLAIQAMRLTPPSGVDDDWLETYVAGHARPGAREHRQFSYLPLPSIGHAHTDPSVRRVMIAGPPGDGALLRQLARRLEGRQLQPTAQTNLSHPPTLVRVHNDNIARFYTQPANAWTSVTPVILPGHDDHKPEKTRALIEKALTQSGVDQPCSFEWSPFPHFPKMLSAHKYDRNKQPIGYIRPDHLLSQTAVHLTLRFNDGLMVPGPLAIGSGRHCGLGLLASVLE